MSRAEDEGWGVRRIHNGAGYEVTDGPYDNAEVVDLPPLSEDQAMKLAAVMREWSGLRVRVRELEQALEMEHRYSSGISVRKAYDPELDR